MQTMKNQRSSPKMSYIILWKCVIALFAPSTFSRVFEVLLRKVNPQLALSHLNNINIILNASDEHVEPLRAPVSKSTIRRH